MTRLQRLFILLLCLLCLHSFSELGEKRTRAYQEASLSVRLGRGIVEHLKWDPTGTKLAISTSYGTWLYDNALNERSQLPFSNVVALDFNGAGNKLLIATEDLDNGRSAVVLWDVEQEKTLRELDYPFFAWHPTQDLLANWNQHHVDVLNVQDGQLVQRFTANDEAIIWAYWGPTGSNLAITGPDSITLWNAHSGEIITQAELPGSLSGLKSVVWAGDGQAVYLFHGRSIYRLPLDRTEVIKDFDIRVPVYAPVEQSQDRVHIAFEGRNNTVVILNLLTGNLITLTGHSSNIHTISWGEQGAQLVSADIDGEVKIWSMSEATLQSALDYNLGDIQLAANPALNTVTIVTGDQTVYVWDASTQTRLHMEHRYNWPSNLFNWTADGQLLVVNSGDRWSENVTRTQIWHIDSRSLIHSSDYSQHPDYPTVWRSDFLHDQESGFSVRDVDFFWRADGRQYVTDHSGEVHIWDASANGPIQTLTDVSCVFSISASGNLLRDCDGQIWHTRTGQVTANTDPRSRAFAWHPVQDKYAVLDTNSRHNGLFRINVVDGQTGDVDRVLHFPSVIGGVDLTENQWVPVKFSWRPDGDAFLVVADMQPHPTDSVYAMIDTQSDKILNSGEYPLRDTQWHPEGTFVAGTTYVDGQQVVRVINVNNLETITQLVVPRHKSFDDSVLGVQWSPDGRHLAIAHLGGGYLIWEPQLAPDTQ